MNRAATLGFSLLGVTCVACREDDAWSGRVEPWGIPRVGNPSSAWDDGDGDSWENPWKWPDAGMDAQVAEYDPSLSYFDASSVYLLGTLSEGTCGRDAIAPVLEPNSAVIGLSCYADATGAQIRPTDGRLFYTERGVLYMFSADLGDEPASNFNYPRQPLSNDVVVSTPGCRGDFSAFRLAASGELFYRCGSNWYDGSHVFVAAFSDTVLQIGVDGTALTEKGVHAFASTAGQSVDAGVSDAGDAGDDAGVDDAGPHDAGEVTDAGDSGEDAGDADVDPEDAGDLSGDAGLSPSPSPLRPFVGLPTSTGMRIIASRTRPDGYWAVLAANAGPNAELWHIDFQGNASQVGMYPALPANQQLRHSSRIDSHGALYQMASDSTAVFRDTIVRRNVQGESSVVYDEANAPLVKIHSSGLITGP